MRICWILNALCIACVMLTVSIAADASAPLQIGTRLAAGKVLPVGFLRVAGNPQRYDSKRIGLSGFLAVDSSFERETYLFLSADAMRERNYENAFLLGWDMKTIPLNGTVLDALNGKKVYLEGTFKAPNESMDAIPFNGYIFEMNYIRLLENKPTGQP